MKWATLLCAITLVHAGSRVYGQITLKEKNAPLEKVLADIEKQTKYVFLYDPDEVIMPPVTIEVKNASLQQTLEKIFKGQPIEYSVVGNNVLLKRKGSIRMQITAEIVIRGRVMDENGQPLGGVTVLNRKTLAATQSDTTGAFEIPGRKGDPLRFSFVGYKDRVVAIGEEVMLHIALEPNPTSGDQVVIIGYGNSRKKDLTGAISTVDVRDLGEVPYNTFDNALGGKAAGVEVIKTDGAPGGMVRVRIRGSSSILGGNDPLYVIDGVPVQVRSNFIAPGFQLANPIANLAGAVSDNSSGNNTALSASFVNSLNSLGGLDPDDIEAITILKDASSAAIYGSKAANGVVIITTKAGKTNTSPRMALSYSSMVSSPFRVPKLLNASQYKTLLKEAALNAYNDDTVGGPPYFHSNLTSAVIDSPGYLGTANTNWVRQVTHTTQSNHFGISITGGGKTSRYFSSLNYNHAPGVVDGTGYQRISARINLETKIESKLQLVTNILAGFSNQDVGDGAYSQALLARPDRTPRDASGNFTSFGRPFLFGLINPAALVTATNNAKTLNLIGSFSASYALSKDLSIRSAVSLNLQNYNQRNYLPGYIYGNVPNVSPYYSGGISSNGNSRFNDWFLENTLSYNRRFNDRHVVTVVVGQSFESTKYSYFTATAGGYPNGNFSNLSTADTIFSVSGDDPSSPQSYLLSFYARTNYSFGDKYLFTFTGRADGSSKFGVENKWGYFPSGAIAWRLSRENFLKDLGWLNDWKIRGSYGLTGNQNIGDQTKHTLYSSVTYAGSNALIPTVLGNEKIKPEITKETDIGMDISLFAERLYATFDYYHRQTSNTILALPVAQSSTYASLTQNAAGLRNRGFEVSIGGEIIRSKNFRWTASINATWNRSLVTRLNSDAPLAQVVSLSGFEDVASTAPTTSASTGNTALVQGKPLGLISGFFVTGIIKDQAQLDAYYQQTKLNTIGTYKFGDPMYLLDSLSASHGYGFARSNVIIGNGAPKYFGGMTQEFNYRNFNLKCLFTFSHGGHLLWAEHGTSHGFYSTANSDVSMLNRYSPANTNTNAPRLNLNNPFLYPSNLDVFSSSFFKLRSVALSYQLDPGLWMKKAGLKNVQFVLSATNVFTITKYPGSDPETSDDAYSVNGGYIDASTYPALRTFSLGFRAAF